jgi:hypothetical protein
MVHRRRRQRTEFVGYLMSVADHEFEGASRKLKRSTRLHADPCTAITMIVRKIHDAFLCAALIEFTQV